jgi:hypothetical protein
MRRFAVALSRLDGVEARVDAEVLREIAENGAKSVGVGCDVGAVPEDAALGCLGDGGEDTHEGGLACAVGAEKTEDAGFEREAEAVEGAMAAAVLLADVFDDKVQWISREAVQG